MSKLFLTLLLIISTFSLNAQYLTGDSLVKIGVKLYDEEKYAEAVEYFHRVNENDSSYQMMLAELAMTYLSMEKYDSAIYVANVGLELPGTNHKHLMRTKGTAYDYKGEKQKAIETYLDANKQYPHNYLLNFNLGATYLGDKQFAKAQACFQEALRSNPYHASSHLQLGKLAARQKQYTRAMLSLETFLALEPSSDRSNDVLIFVENLSNNYIDTTEGHFIEPIEDNELFKEVDHYFKAKIVLTDRYPLPIDFNASLVKQTKMLLDVLPLSGDEDDFWVQMYFPFMKAVKEGEFLEPFLYTILRSTGNESVKKYRNKNDKIINEFYGTGSELSRIKKDRPTLVNGQQDTLTFDYFDNGALYSIGNFNKEGNEQGKWRYYHYNGELKAIGVFENGLKEGEWNYYNADASPATKEILKGGELNGVWTQFHGTGGENIKVDYVKGEVEGNVEWFDEYGNKTGAATFKASKRQGEAFNYYANGEISESMVYKDGELDGPYKSYYATGKLHLTREYKEGKSYGTYKEYHENGQLSTEGELVDDNETGEWRYYYTDGKLSSIKHFNEGKLHGLYKDYYRNGNLKEEVNYNSGEYDGWYKYYTEQGRLYLEEEHRNGIMVKIHSVNEKGEFFSESTSTEGTHSFTNYNELGNKRISGSLKEGKRDGVWKIYYNNGNVMQESHYASGQLQGEFKTFFVSGGLMDVYTYDKGLKQGEFKSHFKNGEVRVQGYYKDDLRDNVWNYYLSDGTLEQQAYFFNNRLNGWLTNYDIEGQVYNRQKYLNGKMLAYENYDINGELLKETNLLSSGYYEIMRDTNYVNARCHVKGGWYEGDLTWYLPNGEVSSITHFVNDNKEGVYTRMHKNGKKRIENSYLNGNKEGKDYAYYESGKVRSVENYFNGMQDSISNYYYENGNLKLVENYRNGALHGDVIHYDISGEVMVKLIFHDDEILAYQYMKEGAYCDTIKIKGGDFTIKAYYNNGQLSYEEQLKDYLSHGLRTKYYLDGKIRQQNSYKYDMRDGKCFANYPDGKKRIEYSCLADLYQGEYKEYYPNGQLKSERTNKLDEVHGQLKEYSETGKLITVENWWSGNFIGFGKLNLASK